MKYSTEDDEDLYNDDELDFGYESEAMIIEPEEYIRFPLPKGKDTKHWTTVFLFLRRHRQVRTKMSLSF
jgi:hypothetical protein